MTKYVKQIIDEIAAKEAIKTEKKILKIPTDAFKMYTQAQQLCTVMEASGQKLPKKEKKQLEQLREELKGMIEGNID